MGAVAWTWVGVVAYALAMAWTCWHGTSPVFGALFLGADLSEAATVGVMRAATVGLLWALLVASPLGRSVRVRRMGFGFLGVWSVVVALSLVRDSELEPWAKPFSQASRWAPPFVLLMWPTLALGTPGSPWPRRLLGMAAAATFAGHGVAAWRGRGAFLDYLFTASSWVGWGLGEDGAIVALRVIAVHDGVLALLLLALTWGQGRAQSWCGPCAVFVALWMALWGWSTAFMRVGHGGWGAWADALERVPNGAVPFAVACLVWRGSRWARTG